MEKISVIELKTHLILDLGMFMTAYEVDIDVLQEMIMQIIELETEDQLFDFEYSITKSDEALQKIFNKNNIVYSNNPIDESKIKIKKL